VVTNHTYDEQGLFAKKIMCLTETANVICENEVKSIKDICVGDKVKTMGEYESVINIFEYETDELYEVEFEDGTIVQCTEDHKFLTTPLNNGWRSVKDLYSKGINTVVDVE